ncbi:MAG TPA: universal stress protein [Sphingomonas sp.]
MKNILLLVHDDPGQEARFQVALDLCRALESHLECVDVAVLPNITGDVYGATAMLLADERKTEAANRTRLEQRLRSEDISWDWRDVVGEVAECIAGAANLADLIVINRSIDDALGPDMREVAGQVLAAAHRPVLAVPDTARALNLSGHALVAWDGSEAAAAALRAAVPLLKLAEKVTILEMTEGSGPSSGEEAAIYLSRHGVAAIVTAVKPLKAGVGPTLLAETRALAPDYIVMGGFGHSRLREALLGGVTRSMLAESPVPLFLAR